MTCKLKLTEDINPDYINEIIYMHQTNNFAALLGTEIIELGDGLCRLRQPGNSRLTNPYGGIHGGVTATLADIAMGVAIRTIGLQPVTVELTVNYLGPAPADGELVAEGRIVHRGTKLYLTESLVTTTDGKIVARGKGIFMSKEFIQKGGK